MSTTNKTLTVIGATGNLSVPVIHCLLNKGTQVKAIVRNLDKAKELLLESVEIVYGNVEDVHNLKQAFQGSDHIYISLNTTSLNPDLPFHTEREGVKNIVEAAKHNGVKQIMQIVGIDSLHEEFATKGMVYKTNLIRIPGMEAIKKSGIPYTFFHCSVFLDSFPVFIQENHFAIIGDHKYPIYYTNTSDLALNIFNAIGNPQAFNKVYAVQGKEGVLFEEAAKRFAAVYAPEVTVGVYPLSTIKEMGLPPEDEAFMEHMLSYVEQLKEEPVAERTWKELGEPETGIEAFAQALKRQQN